MATSPSIYDLSPEFLLRFDWSRPLIVQAGYDEAFRRTVAMLTDRLRLDWRTVTLVTDPDTRIQDWTGEHLVNADASLNPNTIRALPGFDPARYSVMVVVSRTPINDTYQTMRRESCVACFCHALAPLPTLFVDPSGHIVGSYQRYFNLHERQVGPHTLFANIILSNAEIGGLYESALARPAGAVVEIGRFAGGSTMILAQAGRDTGRRGVFSIDIERLSSVDYLLNLNGFTSEDITLIDHDARTVAQCWSAFGDDRGVAFLFIDADHSYDGVRRDLEAWIPLLRPGAMVAFHDLSIPGYGVSRAVYEHVYCNPDFVEFARFDSLLVARYKAAPLLADHQIERMHAADALALR